MSPKEKMDKAKCFYRASTADFLKIPGSPMAYWASEGFLKAFEQFPSLAEFVTTREGLTTGNNDLFVRNWWEVGALNTHFHGEPKDFRKRWYPMHKGGDFRRWYGNLVDIVDWEDNGFRMRSYTDPVTGRVRSHNYNGEFAFKSGFTWTYISSGSFAVRHVAGGSMFNSKGPMGFCSSDRLSSIEVVAVLNSKIASTLLKMLAPTLDFKLGQVMSIPVPETKETIENTKKLIDISKKDWDSSEISMDFDANYIVKGLGDPKELLSHSYQNVRYIWREWVTRTKRLEEENNDILINAYALNYELKSDVPLLDVSLSCNPHYRYGGNRSEEELETLLQCDTIRELVSYAIGCMMGRYSLDKPGLILANKGETLQDYLRQFASPCFAPDDDAILPLTDQEWFADDATNRFREFIRVVWGDEHLQENLDFVAESLCLHAIKPKRGESALDTIRRYLSTQFYKDHLRTYKKRPIYWLFSSGKHKAFECLVYLHRYNEGTLARMRTEYVIPLSAKLNAYAEKLEQDKEASTSAAETKRLEKEIATLHKQQAELAEFDEKLRHYADQRISLDLDDGVKVNYGKFGDLLAEVKAVTGEKPQ